MTKVSAPGELQAFGQHAGHVRLGDSDQLAHALAQAVLEVGDFTAHGGFGDGGNFLLLARGVGDLIDALDGDQRRVHVEGDELVVSQLLRGVNAADHQAGSEFCGVSH